MSGCELLPLQPFFLESKILFFSPFYFLCTFNSTRRLYFSNVMHCNTLRCLTCPHITATKVLLCAWPFNCAHQHPSTYSHQRSTEAGEKVKSVCLCTRKEREDKNGEGGGRLCVWVNNSKREKGEYTTATQVCKWEKGTQITLCMCMCVCECVFVCILFFCVFVCKYFRLWNAQSGGSVASFHTPVLVICWMAHKITRTAIAEGTKRNN